MRSHRMAGAWRSLAVVVGSLTVAYLNGAETSSKANLSQTQRIELGREAFVMKHVEDRSYEEMAEILGASVSALKMRVHRAREALKSALEEVL